MVEQRLSQVEHCNCFYRQSKPTKPLALWVSECNGSRKTRCWQWPKPNQFEFHLYIEIEIIKYGCHSAVDSLTNLNSISRILDYNANFLFIGSVTVQVIESQVSLPHFSVLLYRGRFRVRCPRPRTY